MARRLLASLAICVAAAVFEGLCSGGDAFERFEELESPAFSLPLWSWFVVATFYYAMCFFVVYRIFGHSPGTPSRAAALALVIALMVANGLWNLVFFRLNRPMLAFVAFLPYLPIAFALFLVLRRLDRPASWFVAPYLVYLIYATAWGYGVWRLNVSG